LSAGLGGSSGPWLTGSALILRAGDANVKVVGVRCGSLGLHHHPRRLQPHASRNAASFRLVKQSLPKVIRNEDPLDSGLTVPQQRFDERPISRVIKSRTGQRRCVPVRIKFHESVVIQWTASAVGHVEAKVDVAAALMGLVLPNGSPRPTGEIANAEFDRPVTVMDFVCGTPDQSHELWQPPTEVRTCPCRDDADAIRWF